MRSFFRKIELVRILLACLVVVGATGQRQASAQQPRVKWMAPPQEWHWVVDEKIQGVVHGMIHSESMDRKIGYNIYLPPGYSGDESKRFPVVYYLHGASGSEMSAYEAGIVKRLIREKKIGDVIYVFPNGGHFSRYRDWSDEEKNVKAETWIIRELIPYIDKNYRTIASREGRALTGWSMGGDASLRFACKYPEKFCAAATISAAIDWGADNGSKDTIFHYTEKNAEAIRNGVAIMMVVGEDDRLFAPHEKLVPHLKQLNIPFQYESYPGIGHNLGEMKKRCEEKMTLMLAESLGIKLD